MRGSGVLLGPRSRAYAKLYMFAVVTAGLVLPARPRADKVSLIGHSEWGSAVVRPTEAVLLAPVSAGHRPVTAWSPCLSVTLNWQVHK
jgi:hypothetical protein